MNSVGRKSNERGAIEKIVEPFHPRIIGKEEIEHARALAKADVLLPGMHAGKLLLPRLLDNGAALSAVQTQLTTAVNTRVAVPPAAEWLLDNYYIVEQQLQQSLKDLSSAYYYELPKLAGNIIEPGPVGDSTPANDSSSDDTMAGYPRVYGIAVELVARSDNRVIQESVTRFVSAYQQVAPLSIGELWALPIMLRIALIENLRRLMEQVRLEMEWQRKANVTAEELLAKSTDPQNEFPQVLSRLQRNPALQNSTFLVQLVLRLRDQDPAIAPALIHLEDRISAGKTTLEDLIRTENQRRGLVRTSTGNVITSLRLVAALDWRSFFTSVSLVEQTLNEDPAGAYAHMDFATRDSYRRVVETLARHNPTTEVEIARLVVTMAEQAAQAASRADDHSQSIARRQHVGYYLVDDGLAQLQAGVGYQPSLRARAAGAVMRHAGAFYLGLILVITFFLIIGVVLYAQAVGASPAQQLLVALLSLIPMSAVSLGAVNWTLTVELDPDPPPKLDLSAGIPPEYSTMIVIPALIVSESGLEFLLEHLELRFLANRDPYLHFALLGDFADAPQEHMPEDDALIEIARRRVRELNVKYERPDAFFFFHRNRKWNAGEQQWMGWERKRGKLEEFNLLLRGGETSYVVREGDMSGLPRIKYVITLDADTELPLQVARRLIGTIAHPLNRAVLDPVTRIITHGYGIIQPRVDVVAPAANRSRFAELFAGDTGLDPYASVVSDVYQDFFGRAVYIGKAIYDVDALLGALHGRFPENLLLSHDLLEGGYVRVGLASDIELLEDFPSGFYTFAKRQHRWIRGDWQITDWLFPRVPNGAGQAERNPLPMVERWKIFDNLRRSLVPFSVVLLLVAGWTILPGSSLFWTSVALFAVFFPFIRSALDAFTDRPRGESVGSYLWALAQNLWTLLQRGAVTLIFLLYFTTINLDAIARVILRRSITRRDLLEWTSHAVAERRDVGTLQDYIVRMWYGSAVSVLIALAIAFFSPHSLLIAVPFLLVWFLAPSIAYSISQPFEPAKKPLTPEARQRLRVTARRIWRFYQVFAAAGDHWLPPDNYQVDPQPVVAHRTSPTNIGFLLLSMIAAYDFGYLDRSEFVERAEHIFETLAKLHREHGHFLNWYDTSTLEPLHPLYISTVDSGNFAASLVVFKQACLEIMRTPRDPARVWQGIADTLGALAETLQRAPAAEVTELSREVERLRVALAQPDAKELTPAQFQTRASYLARLAKRLGSATPLTNEIQGWCDELAQTGGTGAASDLSLEARLVILAQRADTYVSDMDFGFLYDPVRSVFAIGYNETAHQRDDSYYDLLASEARLTSFLMIARGEVPVKHWFRMSRPLTRIGGRATLLSWGGTMFEYLMPPLLMRDFTPSLLRQTEMAVIQAQIDYGAREKIPWGISESGFYAFDYQSNFQYRAFGVPELSLKRDRVLPRVIAPYATVLALPYAPHAAWQNLNALGQFGAVGEYGFYEALDFTPGHVAPGHSVEIVSSFMAHHQGMSLVALDNFFYDNVMQTRFHREPIIAAAELLLQERVPKHAPLLRATKQERPLLRGPESAGGPSSRHFTTPHTFAPRAHLLTNNSYSVMLTNSGSGYSTWSPEHAAVPNDVTRWRQDTTLDSLGAFCYVRDVDSGRVWSNTHQPVCAAAQDYHVTFEGETVEFLRVDAGIETKTVVFVAPESDAEIRQMTFTNLGDERRTLELTTYAEVVLDTRNADAAHPAFSKLFVESEFIAGHNVLLFHRRPRSADQPERWAAHFLLSDSSSVTVREYEGDRAKFIGRGRTLADPAALYTPLSNTVGATLDPIMSLRTRVQLAPHSATMVAFITGAANSRTAALALSDAFLTTHDLDRTRDLARARSQMELRHLGITPADATLFQRFASRVLFPDPQLRAPTDAQARSTRGQAALWGYGISGDFPIVLVRVPQSEGLAVVSDALRAHEFWRLRNFHVDLVIVDEEVTSYAGENLSSIQGLVSASLSQPWLDKPGGVFIRRRDLMPPEDYVLLESVARVILRAEAGGLADQLNLSSRRVAAIGTRSRRSLPTPAVPRASSNEQMLFNGVGGFSPDGHEYVITLDDGQCTPAPWTNVLANPDFGCIVSEAGLGMTWASNSQQNKLTPWSNDPVCDPPAEVIYLQELGSDAVWTPTPVPIREPESYTIRHGTGYTLFEHTSHELAQTLRVVIAPDDPVKIMRLSLRSLVHRTRRFRVTFYAEWVLGVVRDQEQQYVVTEHDTGTRALFAWNSYSHAAQSGQSGPPRIAFAAATEVVTGWTANRTEFLGRNGSYQLPAALTPNARELSGLTGASLDPCAALQVEIEVPGGQEAEVEFLLGQGETRTHARALIQKYTDRDNLTHATTESARTWQNLLDMLQVKTPEPAMDALLNRWLLYQTLACRVWGRSAFYQSGGAYGFRDQLQDVMALVTAAPDLTRAQILRSASHQFAEGDVMHWWHPALVHQDAPSPGDKGVRTRISDDYLWLPYVTDYYVRATGDTGILDVHVPFVQLPPLQPNQEEVYGTAQFTQETATLYDHCLRALDHGLRFGAHGLPLMGTGDWNDGMNRVGIEGKGESVWLGWFLHSNLTAFDALCTARGDSSSALRYRSRAEQLRRALDENAWDGEWYRRAYFDDGTPLGSTQNTECSIDAIAQAWAVISAAAPRERQVQALRAVQEHLVLEQERMILLLTPPFVNSQPNPGYIQGYVAGIRENGGQYTHGVLWVVLAHALLGDGDRAYELFSMLNPLNHARTPEEVNQYVVEPYVIAGDVYSHPQHRGRGGWTWYSGSAGWMYRIGVENLLGFKRTGNSLAIDPCIPQAWAQYEIVYHHGSTCYQISVENPEHVSRGVRSIQLDDRALENTSVPLADDAQLHHIRVILGTIPA